MRISYLCTQRCFTTALIALAFTFALSAQKKDDKRPAGPPQDVSVNLLVIGADGKPVTNVKASDIKIFEDGVEQKIDELKPRGPLKYLTLLFDNTGSMRPDLEKITGLRSAFSQLFFFNGTDVKISVIRFVGRDKISIEQPWTTDKVAIEKAIEDLYVEGGQSAVLDALYLAAENFPKRTDELPGQNVVLLISDCEDRDSFYTEKQTLEKLKASNAQVFVASFSSFAPVKPKDAAYLSHNLPLETGGTEYGVDKKDFLKSAVAHLKLIAGEQMSQYILTYQSTNLNRDGQPRKLRVQIADGSNGEKRTGIVRESFAVPKSRKL